MDKTDGYRPEQALGYFLKEIGDIPPELEESLRLQSVLSDTSLVDNKEVDAFIGNWLNLKKGEYLDVDFGVSVSEFNELHKNDRE